MLEPSEKVNNVSMLEHKEGVIIGLFENGVNVVMADIEVTVCEVVEVIMVWSTIDLSKFIELVAGVITGVIKDVIVEIVSGDIEHKIGSVEDDKVVEVLRDIGNSNVSFNSG